MLYPGTESIARITPTRAHETFLPWLKHDQEDLESLLPAVVSDDYWVAPLDQAMYGWRTYWVSPRLDNAVDMIHFMWSTDEDTPEQIEEVHRLAGAGYVYLGYAVRDIEDVRALSIARRNDPDFDSSKDVTMDGRTIYRFKPGVVEQLAENPEDEAELRRIRSEIPVVVERANGALGHPMDTVHVMYLDGNIKELPFGSEFPATQDFLDALFGASGPRAESASR